MRQNLLTIAQSFARRTNLPVPGSVMGTPAAEVRQIVALLEEVGEELTSRFNWPDLQRKAEWVSVATSSQGSIFELAGQDWERILPGTFWNETQREQFIGPIPLQEWQGYASGLNPSPSNIFTITDDELLLWPEPDAGQTLSFYWQTAYWISAPDISVGPLAATKAAFESDEDMPVFDAALMKLGLRYKWKVEKGLPYAEDMRAFEAMAMDKSSRGMLKPTLYMAGGTRSPRPAILVPTNSTIPTA